MYCVASNEAGFSGDIGVVCFIAAAHKNQAASIVTIDGTRTNGSLEQFIVI